MAYDAIVTGARGLFFFGGQFKQVMNDTDKQHGWNWTYWRQVQRPLLEELSEAQHAAALTAPLAASQIRADAADIGVSTRRAGASIYLIAVRKDPHLTGKVRFSGLPTAVKQGTVLAHPGGNPARQVTVANGSFIDPSPFAPHNSRVYRFAVPG
jgi:hypothetical protein